MSYVDGVTIVGVPFCGLTDKGHRDITQNPTCVTITRSSFMNNKNIRFSHLPGKPLREMN